MNKNRMTIICVLLCTVFFSTPLFSEIFFRDLRGKSSITGKNSLLDQIEMTEELAVEYDQQNNSNEYRALYSAQNSFYHSRRAYLIGLLYEKYDSARELEELMPLRWESIKFYTYTIDFEEEVSWYEKEFPRNDEEIASGWYWVAYAKIRQNYGKAAAIHAAVDRFRNRYPNYEKELDLLKFAMQYLGNDPSADRYADRIIELDPDSYEAKQAQMKRHEGKSFELSFTDVLTNRRIDMGSLRGKVVVLDFWATWCGPCVSELPNMKRLYNEYKNQGVEFIGISLDTNTSTVKEYCTENGYDWPQYCEDGKGWDTSLSQKYGISGIPTVFILDKQGRIYSVQARGRLETLIPQLLAQ